MASFFMQRAPSRLMKLVSVVALIAFIPLLIAATYQSVRLISRATGTKASIVIDTSTKLESINTDFFHAFAQGGEEASDMIAPVASEVRALSPKIIRIDHIYDHFDVVTKQNGALSYDFSKLDAMVNTILSLGAKPLLTLSFMPASIAKDGVIINPPNDWNEWSTVVKRTVEHYSGKNEKNLTNLYYEVWNEPDLDQFGKWQLGGEKNYVTLYRYAATGASNAQNVNAFMIGGPATTGLYKNWILALVNSGSRVDFFSWHSYLADPKRFTTDQKNLVTWLLPYPKHATKPTLITEFAFTGSKSSLYGTNYASAHAAAVIRQLISGGPSYLFSFELVDGPNQTDGTGWGLLTHPSSGKKPKPRYYLYPFIDNIRGTRLQLSGEGTWVTGVASVRDNIYRLLLVNFDAGGSHSEQVPVAFTGLSNGSYAYKERLLTGRSSETTENVVKNVLTKSVYMPAQSVALIELHKK